MDNIRKEVNKVNNAIKQKRMVSSYSVFLCLLPIGSSL